MAVIGYHTTDPNFLGNVVIFTLICLLSSLKVKDYFLIMGCLLRKVR